MLPFFRSVTRGWQFKYAPINTYRHEQFHADRTFRFRIFGVNLWGDDGDFSSSDADIRRENTPFFFQPNLIFDDEISFGKEENTVYCSINVRNVPPRDIFRWFRRKGRASARRVRIRLLAKELEAKEATTFRLIWLIENNPIALDEIPNDGQPFPVWFLKISGAEHVLLIPTGPILGPQAYLHSRLKSGTYDLTLIVGTTTKELGRFILPDDLLKKAQASGLSDLPS